MGKRIQHSRRLDALPLLLILLVGASTQAKKGLSLVQLRELARRNGFADPELAAAVAMAESGGNVFAVGDWGRSHGLWQINRAAHPEYYGQNLFDPEVNARAALAISKGGLDWAPWTVFRTGAFRRFMGGAS